MKNNKKRKKRRKLCYGDAARIIARAFLQPALPVTFLAQTMSSAGAATAFERRCRAHQVKLAAWLWATGSDDDENQQQLQLGATRAGVPRSATSGCPPFSSSLPAEAEEPHATAYSRQATARRCKPQLCRGNGTNAS